MNYIDKLNIIFNHLLDEKTYKEYGINKSAGYWKMGTSFFTMFDRLYDKIHNLDLHYPIKIILDHKNLTTQGNNEAYTLTINNINITPRKNKTYVGINTLGQYIRAMASFGICVINIALDNNISNFIRNQNTFNLVYNSKALLSKTNRLSLIKKIINDSFFSNIGDKRNIAYSIIMEFLFLKQFDFSLLEEKNQIFYWRKVIGKYNEKSIKCTSLIKDISTIKKDIYRQGTIGTYKEIIECLNNNYESIESFIDDIYDYSFLEDGKNYNYIIDKQIKEYNLKSKIKTERSKFKNNIFNNRKQKGLIENNDDLYSDIILVNEDDKYSLKERFNECEAAHLYDVFKIKSKVLNELDENQIKYISDPNNGIIMKHEYHKSFDRGQWNFDANGFMIVAKEDEHYLFHDKGMKKIRINPKILNDEMKKFINKR